MFWLPPALSGPRLPAEPRTQKGQRGGATHRHLLVRGRCQTPSLCRRLGAPPPWAGAEAPSGGRSVEGAQRGHKLGVGVGVGRCLELRAGGMGAVAQPSAKPCTDRLGGMILGFRMLRVIFLS